MKKDLLLFGTSVTIFTLLLIDALTVFLTKSIDLSILSILNSTWSSSSTTIASHITDLSGETAVVGFTVIILVILLLRRKWELVFFHISAMVGSLFLFSFLKALTARERPLSKISEVAQLSFPSGHATMSLTMAAVIYILLKDKLSPPLQKIFLWLCILFPVMISFTRIYLNVHYPSDVIAGMSLGVIWMSILFKIYFKNEEIIQA